MLTEREREWIKYRQIFNGYYPYGCLTCSLQRTLCDRTDCLLHPNLGDAAEFSERVAAKLAAVFREIAHVFGDDNTPLPCKYCPANACCKLSDGCDDGILKWAYIAVEEEMDADGK